MLSRFRTLPSTISSTMGSPLATFLPSILRQPLVNQPAPALLSTSAALKFNSRLTSPHNFPQRKRQVKHILTLVEHLDFETWQTHFRSLILSMDGKRWPRMVMASLCLTSTRERENLWALWSCASNGWTGELGSGGRIVKFENQPSPQAESWSCQKVVEEKSSATSCEREARVLQELSQEKVGKVIVPPPRLRLKDTAQWKAFAVPCQFYPSKSSSAV